MHVVIAGGGIAGLEALLALADLAKGRVDMELLSPTDEFVYRALLVAEPFGAADVLTIELEAVAAGAGARHIKDALASVDPAAHNLTTASGRTLDYDGLLIALGAHPVEAVPGALTFSGEAERGRFADLLRSLGERRMRRLSFVIPPGLTWSIAAYELALLTAAERDARGLPGIEIAVVTPERAPLDLFGPAASQLVAARLDEAGIALHLSQRVVRFADRGLLLEGGGSLDADAAVSLPALAVGPIPGLPQRANGFIQTDTAMQVVGLEAVWAAGDATFFPVKQGGLAAQQADAAARAIAARAGAHVPIEAFQPVLRGILITGGTPDFLRASIAERSKGVAAGGHPLWSPATKVAGTYLGPYLARARGESASGQLVDLEPRADPAADRAAHERVVSLILAAADADAEAGDFQSAINWLAFVERLDLVIPSEYVAKRHQWRRKLQRDPAPDAAAERIDPTLGGATAAIADLRKRIGWLRELERRGTGEMGERLTQLDEDMDHLLALSRRTGALTKPADESTDRTSS